MPRIMDVRIAAKTHKKLKNCGSLNITPCPLPLSKSPGDADTPFGPGAGPDGLALSIEMGNAVRIFPKNLEAKRFLGDWQPVLG